MSRAKEWEVWRDKEQGIDVGRMTKFEPFITSVSKFGWRLLHSMAISIWEALNETARRMQMTWRTVEEMEPLTSCVSGLLLSQVGRHHELLAWEKFPVMVVSSALDSLQFLASPLALRALEDSNERTNQEGTVLDFLLLIWKRRIPGSN